MRKVVGDRLLPTWAGGDNAPPLALLKHLEFVEGNDICLQVCSPWLLCFQRFRAVAGRALHQKNNQRKCDSNSSKTSEGGGRVVKMPRYITTFFDFSKLRIRLQMFEVHATINWTRIGRVH